jgi:hypothetical protein
LGKGKGIGHDELTPGLPMTITTWHTVAEMGYGAGGRKEWEEAAVEVGGRRALPLGKERRVGGCCWILKDVNTALNMIWIEMLLRSRIVYICISGGMQAWMVSKRHFAVIHTSTPSFFPSVITTPSFSCN